MQDISNITFVFNQTDGDSNADGYYTVKVDVPEALGDDPDASGLLHRDTIDTLLLLTFEASRDLGYASTIALLLSVILIVFSLVLLLFSNPMKDRADF